MTPTPHPYYKLPTREQAMTQMARLWQEKGEAWLRGIIEERERLIQLSKEDPLSYGVDLPHWSETRDLLKKYKELMIVGGNRSSKTEFSAKVCMECLVHGPVWLEETQRQRALQNGVVVGFFHSSEASSKRQQQSKVYEYLPPQWRTLGKQGDFVSVRYTKTTGFSNFEFMLPNGSAAYFFNYRQDVSVMEGYEFDLVWCDELVPLSFVEALRYRLVTRSGRMLIGFTPVNGYTATVRSYQAGMTVLKSRAVDPDLFGVKSLTDLPSFGAGLPRGHVPQLAQSNNEHRCVVWFHSDANIFNPYQELRAKVIGEAWEKVLIRAYGHTQRSEGSAFPKFSDKSNVLSKDKVKKLLEGPGTRYVSADPGGAKNWFIKWYFVTPEGWVIVYREWPDFSRHDSWALPPAEDKIDWRKGPAQKSDFGRGIIRYKQLILESEGWVWDPEAQRWNGDHAEPIELRVIDPRMGGTPAPSADRDTSIIQQMADEQIENNIVKGPEMIWEKAVAGGAQGGVRPLEISLQLMNEKFDYDEHQDITHENCPNWYVAENCKQSILAYKEFSGNCTDKCALKDVIDPDRYFVNSNLDYIDPNYKYYTPPRGGY